MSAAAMRRRKLKAKRVEKIAERERLSTLRGYADRLEEQRVARNTRDAILSDGMPNNFSGRGLTFPTTSPRILESTEPGTAGSLAKLLKHKEATIMRDNSHISRIVRNANTETGAAAASNEAAAAADDDSNEFESDTDLAFPAFINALQEFDQSTILTNVNGENPNENGLYAIVPIVAGRGADRAVKYNACVEMPSFDEMLANNPDFFRGAYGDMIEGRIARGVRAFASNRSTAYDLPVIVRRDDGTIDLSSWNEVRRRVGRVGVDKSWTQVAKAICEMLSKKQNFHITPRDLKAALSNAELAAALFQRVPASHWLKILEIAIKFATSQNLPVRYLEQWKETRDAKKASTSATFDVSDL